MKGTPLKTNIDCLGSKQQKVAFHSNPPTEKSHILDFGHTNMSYMKDRSVCGAFYFLNY